MKTCRECCRTLPLERFESRGHGKRSPLCKPCMNDNRRLRKPLTPVERDPEQIHINNVFNLWHGPVSRVPLRSAA